MTDKIFSKLTMPAKNPSEQIGANNLALYNQVFNDHEGWGALGAVYLFGEWDNFLSRQDYDPFEGEDEQSSEEAGQGIGASNIVQDNKDSSPEPMEPT